MLIAAEVVEHAPNAEAAERLRALRPDDWLAVSLPIDLDIAMYPTGSASERIILAFFERFGRQATDVTTVRPDLRLDPIAQVFPDFAGCVNAVFQEPADKP